jgi:hypothetical protein
MKPEAKEQLGRASSKWKDDIKMTLKFNLFGSGYTPMAGS